MSDLLEHAIAFPNGTAVLEPETGGEPGRSDGPTAASEAPLNPTPAVEAFAQPEAQPANDRHAAAGRKGARRVHQLIQEGRLYEQEHGLKSGRQRLRQLIELGKLYEQEHGLRPDRPTKRRARLSRTDREELLATLLDCLVRIAKPSFRDDLARLVAALHGDAQAPAA